MADLDSLKQRKQSKVWLNLKKKKKTANSAICIMISCKDGNTSNKLKHLLIQGIK